MPHAKLKYSFPKYDFVGGNEDYDIVHGKGLQKKKLVIYI